MRELRRAAETGGARGLVGLTFDDGHENFLQAAVPILENFGFSATVFVVAGLLGEENVWDQKPRMKLLEASDIREVSERGMEVGSHSMMHVKLSSVSPKTLEHEVRDSYQTLSEVLGNSVDGFCYPYGALDGDVVRAVRRAGYDYACAYKARVERSAYDVPRIYIGERDGALRFTSKLFVYRGGLKIVGALR